MVSCADFGAAGANAVEQTGLDVMVRRLHLQLLSDQGRHSDYGDRPTAISTGLLGDIYVVRTLEVWNRDFNRPILTGPAIVDASNIDAVVAGAALGARYLKLSQFKFWDSKNPKGA